MYSSSSDDDDVFNFKKRAAAVARNPRGFKYNEEEEDESDSDDSDTSDRSQQQSKKRKLLQNDQSSDEEDDDNNEGKYNQNSQASQDKEDVVVTLDSDDDSDFNDYKLSTSNTAQTVPIPTKISMLPNIDELVADTDKDTQMTLQKAREARKALLNTTCDINVDVSDDEIIIEDVKVVAHHSIPHKRHEDVQLQGPTVSLKLRTTIICGTSSMQGSTDTFTMYKCENFSSLLEKYRNKYKLLPSDTVKMSFDGQALKLNMSPNSLDMDDDDLVDVSLTNTPSLKGSNNPIQTQSTKPASDDAVTIITRIKGGDTRITHKYVLKKNDPFRKLISAYRKEHGYSSVKPVSLEFNGKSIDPDSTPGAMKMKGEVLVEIIDTEQKLKQLERSGKLLDTELNEHNSISSSSNKISLKLRITNQGESHVTEQTYELGLRDSFRILVQQFCEKNNITENECKFTFDGMNLALNGTPDGEGLEGGEIIEVSVHRTVKAPMAESTKNPSAAFTNTANGIIAVNANRNNVSFKFITIP